MATVHPYLMFDGKCKEAFEFYKNAFGKEFADINFFGDMPPQEGTPPLTDAQKEMVMHVKLPISAETVLYGSDIFPGTPGYPPGFHILLRLSPEVRCYGRRDTGNYTLL